MIQIMKKKKPYTYNSWQKFESLSVSGMNQAWVLGKFQQINDFIDGKLKQYKMKKKAVAVEYNDKEIVISETILQKLERRSLLDKVVALAVIAGAINSGSAIEINVVTKIILRKAIRY